MKSGICNANGHLIDVITLLTAHWGAGERACKRDKIKRDSSCSNLSHNSSIKLQHSNCSDSHHSHCWHLLLCGFGGCSCNDAGCWAVKRRSGCGAGKARLENELERFCHLVLCGATQVAAAQRCLDKTGGDGEELNDSVCLLQWDREMLKKEKAGPPGVVCGLCEAHKFLWGVLKLHFVSGFPGLATESANLL